MNCSNKCKDYTKKILVLTFIIIIFSMTVVSGYFTFESDIVYISYIFWILCVLSIIILISIVIKSIHYCTMEYRRNYIPILPTAYDTVDEITEEEPKDKHGTQRYNKL